MGNVLAFRAGVSAATVSLEGPAQRIVRPHHNRYRRSISQDSTVEGATVASPAQGNRAGTLGLAETSTWKVPVTQVLMSREPSFSSGVQFA